MYVYAHVCAHVYACAYACYPQHTPATWGLAAPLLCWVMCSGLAVPSGEQSEATAGRPQLPCSSRGEGSIVLCWLLGPVRCSPM